MLNEAGFPGSISNASMTEEQKTLHLLGFEHDTLSSLSTFEGVELTPDMQSKLSKGMHTYGDLTGRLKRYFNTKDYKFYRQQMTQLARSDKNGSKGSKADAYRQQIFKDLRQIFRTAKEDAANQVLRSDPQFRQIRDGLAGRRIADVGPAPNTNKGKIQGLIDFASTGQFPA